MTYRQTLRWLAFDRHGIITTQQAAAAGVPAVEVRKLATRGALTRVGHGVYRMDEAPTTALTPYAQALALVGHGAYLADESVLAVHDLALVNPRKIKVATTRRVRAALPPTIELVPAEGGDHVEHVDGLPTMPLRDALIACQGRVMRERLVEATRAAAARDLLDAQDVADVLDQLGKAPG
ncbi:MAG: type IV toxin-antitoxin system AbiEi family antitoxin domain-containing protein [Actinomycetales bacterium]|nr:type IV toxin-antitoxin system AbiEi family antitoxin domain-containing protein [Actinomycetales bacterium]